jgi:hypothetical protein
MTIELRLACGWKGEYCFVSLPGAEMKYLVENRIIQKWWKNTSGHTSFTKLFWRKGGKFSRQIEDWENSLPDFFKISLFTCNRSSAFEAVSKRKKTFRKELKGYVDSLAEIINDIVGLKGRYNWSCSWSFAISATKQ